MFPLFYSASSLSCNSPLSENGLSRRHPVAFSSSARPCALLAIGMVEVCSPGRSHWIFLIDIGFWGGWLSKTFQTFLWTLWTFLLVHFEQQQPRHELTALQSCPRPQLGGVFFVVSATPSSLPTSRPNRLQRRTVTTSCRLRTWANLPEGSAKHKASWHWIQSTFHQLIHTFVFSPYFLD